MVFKMTEKRYFKRMWEDEYYIFDSYTISEKEFDEKVEYEDYQAFADSMTGEEVVDKLNKLNNVNKELKDKNSQLQETLAFRSNQLALMERLVDDLGSEEMARQMEEILND